MRTLPARTTLGVNFWIAASFCHNKDTLSPKKWSAASRASSRARITSVKSQQGKWWSDWQGKAMIGLGSDKNYHDYNMMRKNLDEYDMTTNPLWFRKLSWLQFDDKTVMITIWWLCKAGVWPRVALLPLALHSLPLSLRPDQRKLYFFTHAQVYL